MEFEFKVSNLISKVDALIMKYLQFKQDCNKNNNLLNEKIENYNKWVEMYNKHVIDKAEAQLEGVSDHKLMLDLTEVKQKYREVKTLFSWKDVPYDYITLKSNKEIQEEVPYMEGIYAGGEKYHYYYNPVRSFKYNTRYYSLWGDEYYEDVSVDVYVYLESKMNLVKEKTLDLVKELQAIKDKLLLAKKYEVANITLGEGDLETLTFYENNVYKEDTPCWEDMHKNEKVLKFIKGNTNGK